MSGTDQLIDKASGNGALAEKALKWLFPATAFLSAALLFILQPLFAKMLTPKMGGTPAVWNTALVFYQAALLIGYFYAHILATRFSPKWQMIIHACLLFAGLIFLPISIKSWVGAPDVAHPVTWTLLALAGSILVPLVAISATAPLVQSWHAGAGVKADPYKLYVASNLGSFLVLGAYPVVIEPLIGAKNQSYIWAGLYLVLASLLMACAYRFLKAKEASGADDTPIAEVATQKTTPKTTWSERLKWMGFAAPPSALLIAVTTHLVTDVASVPLLWLPPLALFLLTFVIAFSATGTRILPLAQPLKMTMVFILAALMAADLDGGLWGLFVHLGTFFIIVLCCHIELAGQRPEPARLTEFYLWMSLGGVIGGALAALVAPVVLNSTIEYQIILAACLAVGVWYVSERNWAIPAVLITIAMAYWYNLRLPAANFLTNLLPTLAVQPDGTPTNIFYNLMATYNDAMAGAVLCAVAAIAATMASRSAPIVAAIGAVALLLPALNNFGPDIRYQKRSFFGVLKVEDSGTAPSGWRYLSHGTTLHGVMSLNPARNREPMSYYYHRTPIGELFAEASAAKPTTLHAGVIGLGMGATTCYARPGQTWRVFEIDKDVVTASFDPNLIGFVPRCAPQAELIMGDARLSMSEQPDGFFDIILVDAFSSDAIPTHMLTQEAIAMIMSKTKPDGLIIVHISNRYLELAGIVADAAYAGGFVPMEGYRDGDPSNPNADTGVHVVVLAHNYERLAGYKPPMWRVLTPQKRPVPWTDDHTDILRALTDQERAY